MHLSIEILLNKERASALKDDNSKNSNYIDEARQKKGLGKQIREPNISSYKPNTEHRYTK